MYTNLLTKFMQRKLPVCDFHLHKINHKSQHSSKDMTK